MQATWKHRHAITDSGPSGRFGRVGLSLLGLFGVALPLLAPVIDLLAIYGLVLLDRSHTALAWLAMLALQFATAAVAFTSTANAYAHSGRYRCSSSLIGN